ncbi:deaminase [Herbaspirillum sp. VT-16-41]|uniref:deaminase n=1 Tax=Herbaspirillum sp. VT-16-41 TaxID=1953765 RepID=UPI0034D26112
MAQSHLLSLRSTCTRLMVGATIVRDKRIIAGGYNGSVSGGVHCIDEGCLVVDGHCVRTVHAEANALLQCAKFGVPTDNADIYVTHFPCWPAVLGARGPVRQEGARGDRRDRGLLADEGLAQIAGQVHHALHLVDRPLTDRLVWGGQVDQEVARVQVRGVHGEELLELLPGGEELAEVEVHVLRALVELEEVRLGHLQQGAEVVEAHRQPPGAAEDVAAALPRPWT